MSKWASVNRYFELIEQFKPLLRTVFVPRNIYFKILCIVTPALENNMPFVGHLNIFIQMKSHTRIRMVFVYKCYTIKTGNYMVFYHKILK